MAITTVDGLVAGARQKVPWIKTSARTTIANGWFTQFDQAGNPGAGTIAGLSQTNGSLVTDATAGHSLINAFGGGATGYLGTVEFANTVASRLMLVDVLARYGTYAFNVSTGALSSQPDISGRLPGSNYAGTQIWYECATAITTNQTVTVTYTDESGNTGATTGAVAFGLAPTLGRLMPMPLAAGDSGVRKIESVTSTGATVGTFNILIVRPLWTGRVPVANSGDCHSWDRVGFPTVYDTSALQCWINADSTGGGVPELLFDVING
jgi:hypothetical protein